MTNLRIDFEHVLGVRQLSGTALTVDDVLSQNNIPRTMVQTYLARGDQLTPVPSWTRLKEVPGDVDRILVRALRNTLFDTILPRPTNFDLPVNPGAGFAGIVSDSAGFAIRRETILDESAAKALVSSQVQEFIDQYSVSDHGCVFGVSGGGDSNALAFGLAGLPKNRLTAFTLVFGDLMTQAAADRATVLCQELGIEHHVYSDQETAELLGVSTSLEELYADFRIAFGQEALHFFGTFLILKAARIIGHARGFADLAFGYNREDLLAELLFMLMNGRPPLSYPIRPIGEQRIIMPVWKVPKLLLDACHPTFSLENYRERDPHTTRQRSLAFYLGHALDSIYPGFGMSILEGSNQAFAENFGQLTHNLELDVFVTSDATPERLGLVTEVLSKHFFEG